MTKIRIAAASLNQTPLDWDHNSQNVRRALLRAREEGANLVCLPELCLTGYGCEDAFLWPGTRQMAERVLGELLDATVGLIACLGLPLEVRGRIYNVAALVVDGDLVGFAAKRHLAGEGLHYEPRWFTPWPAGCAEEVTVLGRVTPVGDLLFDVGGVGIGFEICEDAWVRQRPGFELAAAGARVVLNPSASHFAFGKHRLRRALVLAGAQRFNCVYAYANLLGNEAGRAIYDGDALIAEPASGAARIVSETRRLSFADYQLTCATVNLPSGGVPVADGDPACASSSRTGLERRRVAVPFCWPAELQTRLVSARTPSAGADGELSKEEAFARVIALGLFDYLRKSRSRGFVVSLSGGADSAAVATLVRLMVRLCLAELEVRGMESKLGYFLGSCPPEPELCERLLTTLYQATQNSSDITRDAARRVAEALHARHHEFYVQALVDEYRTLTEGALGRALTWETDDIALQNIQARVRAPSAWMLANVGGALLLSTSNRSEAAVGYATMDGDTSGGLSPIAGIDKAFLRSWLVWMERFGPQELGPTTALSAVNCQAPTAELRPLTASQTDEADLMPYPVLDVVERLAVVVRLPVAEVYRRTCQEFSHYPPEQIKLWVKRFYRLFSVNQWKRERYAPSFHVDDANLDPKTWCRFPILSGGFQRELTELDSQPDSGGAGEEVREEALDGRADVWEGGQHAGGIDRSDPRAVSGR